MDLLFTREVDKGRFVKRERVDCWLWNALVNGVFTTHERRGKKIIQGNNFFVCVKENAKEKQIYGGSNNLFC